MKQILCLALCIFVAAFACSCNNGENNQTEAPSETQAESVAATESGTKEALKAFMDKFDDTPTVGDKPVYKDEKLTVTAHGINYAVAAGPELHLTIENNYDTPVTVQAPFAVVNGYMTTPEMSIDVPAKSKANGNLTFSYFDLAVANITCVRNIEFSLTAVNSENYSPVFSSNLLSVSTSADDGTKNTYDESGQPVYDENDIKIILKGVNTDRPFSEGSELTVYMYNGTDKNIAVQTGSVKVNGYDMTSTMNRTILPKCHAVDVVTFYDLDLQEYSIDTIDSVKVSFDIRDAESWTSIAATDEVTADLKAPTPSEAPTEAATEAATENK